MELQYVYGYANSVQTICDMLGIKSDTITVLTGMENFKGYNDQQKQEILDSIDNNNQLNYLNHVVNSITFDDGTSYLLDMTGFDTIDEFTKKNNKEIDTSYYYLTDAKHFQGALQYNGKLLAENPKQRDISHYQVMPREEIEAAREKIKHELPYIDKLEQLDEIRQHTENNKQATLKYKISELRKTLMQKIKNIFTPKQKLLPEATDELMQKDTKRQDFLNELSNNGQYRQQTEQFMNDYSMQKEQEKSEPLKTNGFER